MEKLQGYVYFDDITRIHIPQEYPKISALLVLKAFAKYNLVVNVKVKP